MERILDLHNRILKQFLFETTWRGTGQGQDIAGVLCAEVERLVPDSVATVLRVNLEQGLEILSGDSLPRAKIALLEHMTLTDADIAALRANPEEAYRIVWRPGEDETHDIALSDCRASALFDGRGQLIGIFALYSRHRHGIADWGEKIVSHCRSSCVAIIEYGRTRRRLDQIDRHDALTGLPNRAAIFDLLQKMTTETPTSPFALIILDVDLFQDFNDAMGYEQGDRLLQIVACRFSTHCRGDAVIGRLGGDNFAIVIPGEQDTAANDLARDLVATLRSPIRIRGQDIVISCSTGIGTFPENGTEVEQVVHHAQIALREAKKATRGSVQNAPAATGDDVEARVLLGSAMRKAVQKSEFRLFYQPQICMESGTIYGVEALARWYHPAMGLIQPSQFIPVAEQTGQIEIIDRWSMEEACRQMAEWDRAGMRLPTVSVNVSAVSIRNTDLPRRIAALLKRYRLEPRRLTVEITESAMMQQSRDTGATLSAMLAIGIGLALDDFGTGFSSLSRLTHLPLTEIKIDRSFVTSLERDVGSMIVTEAAITIGKRLGVKVVTEGVEEIAQVRKLRQLGCDVVQGYLISKPLPSAEIPNWLQSRDGTITESDE
ncbi:diguanylate cyclase/phosphodiesterase [Gluconacetobacter diazotrophicus PA1 5]|uniref:EAL domain-containing protein n=1 Tax=Gluconacetobacter diazotrophicus TaxID=33996 RepID=A0A7W4NIR2_GLUDI|nr:EAL domain-containing protein [Gluconacetobacter diazotrophicus]ACI52113.1 diguanylate cyclase/phosphodiesterase [Gluconacetobacter diazotrophicus PA1 5]MBB2158486.1 EAL domain-containing protein [Gluconacetobacter diazotrophicus]TWA97896.1 diguanylate cyclase (GGDEF)-like protein [Gluconacetobacter diazotrophicus]